MHRASRFMLLVLLAVCIALAYQALAAYAGGGNSSSNIIDKQNPITNVVNVYGGKPSNPGNCSKKSCQ
ncbi:hypothetical protein [Gorillibacterium sp. sgz5001074]|uniref:hypothetical protein n=1 Tax=Gorillibacterium sp. sgz5001074 TaxID=3446695 RepID=UPI003F66BF4E